MNAQALHIFPRTRLVLTFFILCCALVLIFVPVVSFAVPAGTLPGISTKANRQCARWRPEWKIEWECSDTVNGSLVTGICVAPGVCKATSFMDIFGNAMKVAGSAQGVISVGAFVQRIFGGSPTAGTPTTGTQQCTGYYRVTVRTSDPCAIYVPPTTSSQLPQNTSKQLLDALKGPSIGDALLQQANKVGTPSQAPPPPVQNQMASLPSGAKGNISLTSSSATIQAGVRDVPRNTESVGFFGSNVPQGAQPQGFVERMCLLRPWQNPQVAYGIPAYLFDNLCSSKGLRVGVLPGAAIPALPPAGTQAKAIVPTATSTIILNPPKVDIWAVPASVAVGSRTSIFWNTKGASSCTISSSDGTFSAETVSGNSASAPLAGPTTFFISCLAPDGSRANGYVKVNIGS